MKRGWVLVALLGVVVGCKDKAKNAPPPSPVEKTAKEAAAPLDRAPTKIDGPSVAPVITNSITFFVPKNATWWGEMAFSCYAGAIRLSNPQWSVVNCHCSSAAAPPTISAISCVMTA